MRVEVLHSRLTQNCVKLDTANEMRTMLASQHREADRLACETKPRRLHLDVQLDHQLRQRAARA